jgi:hypothetical protein
MRIEVRCCCQPTKLLGWIDVARQVKDGDVLIFPLASRDGGRDLLPLAEPFAVEQLRLPVATFSNVVLIAKGTDDVDVIRTRRIAIKSEETPVETLRRIPGFEEARS